MAAISTQTDVCYVWQMPFAQTAAEHLRKENVHDDNQQGLPPPTADAARKADREAVEAYRRFTSFKNAATFGPATLDALNPLTAHHELREYAASQGLDYEGLVVSAARHFTSPKIVRRTTPLSREELGCLFEDDQRTFDR